jgi:hypothetical protein
MTQGWGLSGVVVAAELATHSRPAIVVLGG